MPSLTTTAGAIAATAISLSHDGDKSPPPDNGECRLLGPFAIFVQGALGLLALLALVYKRWRERPQRPLKIWFFDVSKQVVGSVLVHIANLLMSMLSSGQFSIALDVATVSTRGIQRRMVDSQGNYKPNPCSFYLLNLAIDTTIGIPILIFLLRILTALFAMTPVGNPRESIESGNYGNPPRTWWWCKQSMIYFIGLMGMKICVLIIFLLLPWISRIGDWALRWTEGDEVLQVVFVMLVFPVIMNATQYYIIDSFIKNQKPDHERIPDVDRDDSFDQGHEGRYEDPTSGSSDEIHSGDEDDEVLAKADELKTKAKASAKTKRGNSSSSRPGTGKSHSKKVNKDYDPMFDGESSPTVVGSASTSERERLALKEADSEDESEQQRLRS
ncbi:uncharacterized protein LY89DRAFT_581983 [Mollisia scopiformis]|uniref:Vacuolar membrane protein n=1 Tax=Mollisia scopiformis TaxID=149040 RepID=A0A194XEF1_MOLSC|nr:uncharacterized protein LY89DRAFT_581983 [Mollisia scopiformis]KUJ18524.1 hypothetical protein LY89DRAFT_581983 [Mollisia scopiformis]